MSLCLASKRLYAAPRRQVQRTRCVSVSATLQPHTQFATATLSAVTAAVLLSAAPVFAEDTTAPSTAAPEPTTDSKPASNVSSISFARVDMKVTQKLRERDENLAWKCKGVNMYDCDGELAEAAEKRFEEMASLFRGGNK